MVIAPVSTIARTIKGLSSGVRGFDSSMSASTIPTVVVSSICVSAVLTVRSPHAFLSTLSYFYGAGFCKRQLGWNSTKCGRHRGRIGSSNAQFVFGSPILPMLREWGSVAADAGKPMLDRRPQRAFDLAGAAW